MTNAKLRKRSDLHLTRKIWHVLSVFIIILIHLFSPKNVIDAILIFAWISCLFTEVSRLRSEKMNRLVISILGPVMRQGEINKISGLTYMLIGVSILHTTFSENIITLSLLFLCMADPAASYIGIRFGKRKLLLNKTFEGFITAFSVCFIIAWTFFTIENLMPNHIIITSLLAGLSGAFSELIPVGKLDDNLTLPVISASLLSVIFYFFTGHLS